jgi:hypothetical protein
MQNFMQGQMWLCLLEQHEHLVTSHLHLLNGNLQVFHMLPAPLLCLQVKACSPGTCQKYPASEATHSWLKTNK